MSGFNNSDLFLEPKTNQYGSHMIMTNVHKQTKTKFINIDTKFRDEYNYLQKANYNITLPERITDVKSIEITNIEVPITYYNISMNLGNSYFKIMGADDSNPQVITIPDGQYTITTLVEAITSLSGITIEINGSKSRFFASGMKIVFDIDSTGNNDKFNFKFKLGWILGFRNTTYTIIDSITSEGVVDLTGPKYLYLAIDEFNNKGSQNSFVTPVSSSIIDKKVIARMAMNSFMFPHGSIASFTRYNGLTTDMRSYSGIIDLMRLNVQLLNENGTPMQLNGIDFSFLMKINHE